MSESPRPLSDGASLDAADDTSDRLYTPEELAAYAAEQARADGAPAPDPLTDPLPAVGPPAGEQPPPP
ncbi:MAG: hypothetical protein JHD21_12875, partial [Nocardioides sp.]|nr:hypothetical protein [Nocardioides sp.]